MEISLENFIKDLIQGDHHRNPIQDLFDEYLRLPETSNLIFSTAL